MVSLSVLVKTIQDLEKFLYEGYDPLNQEDKSEAKATCLIKKNITAEIYYLVRNLIRPHQIWTRIFRVQ